MSEGQSTAGATATAAAAAALEITDLSAGYGQVTILRNVNLRVAPGQVVALLGANGAGKTTLLKTAAGLIRPSRGQILVGGQDVTRAPAHRRARAGLCLIPEGRGIFRNLSVAENLRLSAPSWVKDADLESVYERFPILKDRRGQTAGTMSGGQQQMLALARATLAQPSLVLVDEVSMGLAPVTIDIIFEALKAVAASGVALLVVEQYVHRALEIADSVYLIKKGEVTSVGDPSHAATTDLFAEYMGQSAEPAVDPGDPAAADPAVSTTMTNTVAPGQTPR
jgi:branched-chain amino acid transport system ATP-binding protein